jgi:hypothetical protein
MIPLGAICATPFISMVGDRHGRKMGIFLGSVIMGSGGLIQGASMHSKIHPVHVPCFRGYENLRKELTVLYFHSRDVPHILIHHRIWTRFCKYVCTSTHRRARSPKRPTSHHLPVPDHLVFRRYIGSMDYVRYLFIP